MITRQHGFPRLFGTHPMYRDNLGGLLVVKEVNGIPNMWPVARPGGAWRPDGCPNYLRVHETNRPLRNRLLHMNTPGLTPPIPNVEMDPSDSRTWQRPYLFT